jgi:uncharacterized FlaG/YvyC family protein
MATKERIQRPSQTITAKITPISNELKIKVASAIGEVVNKIKEAHLN